MFWIQHNFQKYVKYVNIVWLLGKFVKVVNILKVSSPATDGCHNLYTCWAAGGKYHNYLFMNWGKGIWFLLHYTWLALTAVCEMVNSAFSRFGKPGKDILRSSMNSKEKTFLVQRSATEFLLWCLMSPRNNQISKLQKNAKYSVSWTILIPSALRRWMLVGHELLELLVNLRIHFEMKKSLLDTRENCLQAVIFCKRCANLCCCFWRAGRTRLKTKPSWGGRHAACGMRLRL